MPTILLNLLDVRGGKTALAILLVILAITTITDLRSRLIPNLVTLPAALVAVFLHLALDGLSGGLSAVFAYLIWFGAGFSFYRFVGGVGGGDIKLFMACAAFVGLLPTLYIAFASFLLHTLWLFVRWFATGTAWTNFARVGRWLCTLILPGMKVTHFTPVGMPDQSPHGPFILAGTVAISLLWWGNHVQF